MRGTKSNGNEGVVLQSVFGVMKCVGGNCEEPWEGEERPAVRRRGSERRHD